MSDSNLDDMPGPLFGSGIPSYEAETVSLDSEIDFDDEQEDDQLPLDVVEAAEMGVLLDDPEALSDQEDE